MKEERKFNDNLLFFKNDNQKFQKKPVKTILYQNRLQRYENKFSN